MHLEFVDWMTGMMGAVDWPVKLGRSWDTSTNQISSSYTRHERQLFHEISRDVHPRDVIEATLIIGGTCLVAVIALCFVDMSLLSCHAFVLSCHVFVLSCRVFVLSCHVFVLS